MQKCSSEDTAQDAIIIKKNLMNCQGRCRYAALIKQPSTNCGRQHPQRKAVAVECTRVRIFGTVCALHQTTNPVVHADRRPPDGPNCTAQSSGNRSRQICCVAVCCAVTNSLIAQHRNPTLYFWP